ncbi:MAG TPA: c-type cytochrome [Vicinamibacterales bacterium]
MRLTNIVWGAAVITAAIILTAVLSTASVKADGVGDAGPQTKAGKTAQIARGKYLVDIMGCHDCHTPMKLGPNGPEWDMTRALSGHPEDAPSLPPANLPAGYMAAIGGTFTSFSGPWGTSFTKNLTPDKETGLGDWTVEEFIATMQTGRERGKGRPVLPPMPVQNLKALSDSDIRALFAYLQSLPAIKNRTPQPVEPGNSQQ